MIALSDAEARQLSQRVKSYKSSSHAEAAIIRDQFRAWPQNHATHGGEGVIYLMHAKSSDYWLVSLFSLRGRAIPFTPLIVYIIYCTLIIYPLVYYAKTDMANSLWTGLSQAVGYVSVALFFLLAFRVNAAYDRWARGRQLWAHMSSYVLGISGIISAGMLSSRKLGRRMERWSIAYIVCLKRSLRNEDRIQSELEGILIPSELDALQGESVEDRADFCLTRITAAWGEGQRGKKPLIEAGSKMLEKIVPYMSQDQQSIKALVNTPMPYAYVSHLRLMMVLWLAVLPFIFCASMGYFALLPCVFVSFMILGIDGMALEIEWPYGRKWNDLPIENWCEECVTKVIRSYLLTSALPNEDGHDEGEAESLTQDWDKVMKEEEEILQEQLHGGSFISSLFSRRHMANSSSGPRPQHQHQHHQVWGGGSFISAVTRNFSHQNTGGVALVPEQMATIAETTDSPKVAIKPEDIV